MVNQKGLLGKYGLTILEVILLALFSAALTYLSVPWLVKVSLAFSKAVEPNPHADIQPIGVFGFMMAMMWGHQMATANTVFPGGKDFLPTRGAQTASK
jgi:hypothetical protein